MERKIKISIGEVYHIYSRGVDKRIIFLSIKDKERFIKLLYLCNSKDKFKFDHYKKLPLSKIPPPERIVAVGAYCLMNNHFHILVKEITENGISTFMEKLLTAYSMYFNKKYRRSGALFEGRFKARHVDKDNYLRYLYCYIHLNPIKFVDSDWQNNELVIDDKFRDFLDGYYFSSYFDYKGQDREEGLILSRQDFPDYFQRISFEKIVKNWIEDKSYFDNKKLL